MEELGLEVREIVILQVLRVLSHDKPWKGSYYELANICKCGDRKTVQRAVSKLIELGCVTERVGGLMVQNDPKTGQNDPKIGQNNPQIGQIDPKSKRKEPKENINNNYNKSVCENNNITAPTRTDNFLDNNNSTPPTWEEWRDFANSKQIDYVSFRKAWAYYRMRGWKNVADWKAALYYWDLRDRR